LGGILGTIALSLARPAHQAPSFPPGPTGQRRKTLDAVAEIADDPPWGNNSPVHDPDGLRVESGAMT